MANIEIYTTTYCGYCRRAKLLLAQKELAYQEISIDNDANLRQEMMEKSGRRTVPQIFIDGKHIGGCDDLYALERSGELDKLITETVIDNE